MYLLYIDESGSKDLLSDLDDIPNGQTRYFVMGAVLIDTTTLSDIEKEIWTLKEEYLTDPYKELKTTNKAKLFKRGKHSESLKTEVYQCIANSTCLCFGAQADKLTLQTERVVSNSSELYRLCFEHILISVNAYFKYSGVPASVTVLIDNIDTSSNKKVYQAYREALKSDLTIFEGLDKQFSPSINFVDSEFTVGVQLADFVAGALWRGVEQSKKEHSKMLIEKFPKNQNGKYIGFSYRKCENLHKKGTE